MLLLKKQIPWLQTFTAYNKTAASKPRCCCDTSKSQCRLPGTEFINSLVDAAKNKFRYSPFTRLGKIFTDFATMGLMKAHKRKH